MPDAGRTKTKDPVDLATGEVLLAQTDLDLPAILPLVLARTHLSSYRIGRSFGPSWACTVDQRVEVDAHGVVFVAADGMVLVYPTPEDGTPVWAEEGPRWPLHRLSDGYQVTQPEPGHSLRFTSTGALVAITDRADITRDPAGAPVEIAHSGGYRVAVDTVDGLISALRVGEVTVMRFGYDDQDHLAEVIKSSQVPQRFSYDTAGRLTEWVDRNGMWYCYHYDNAGRCIVAEGAGGQLTTRLEFDRDDLVTIAADSLGHVTRYHLNPAQQVVTIVDPLGGETISQWDRFDRLLARTDPLGRTTRYDWTGMRVAIVGQHDSQFRGWAAAGQDIPLQRGEILVARDTDMVTAWDEHGYQIPDSPEGPFSILYEPCPAHTFSVLAQEDPYARDEGFGFEPYDTLIIGRDLTLTTVVTPDNDSEHSRRVIDAVVSVLAGQ